jgi:hypothetical protein
MVVKLKHASGSNTSVDVNQEGAGAASSSVSGLKDRTSSERLSADDTRAPDQPAATVDAALQENA